MSIPAGPGIDPTKIAPQATLDFASNGAEHTIEIYKQNADCMASEFEVYVLNQPTNTAVNGGFTFMVP